MLRAFSQDVELAFLCGCWYAFDFGSSPKTFRVLKLLTLPRQAMSRNSKAMTLLRGWRDTGFAMLRLRRTHPSLPRPYRAPRSSAVICIGASVLVTLSTLWSQPLAALAGFAFVAAGWATHGLLLSPSPSASSSH